MLNPLFRRRAGISPRLRTLTTVGPTFCTASARATDRVRIAVLAPKYDIDFAAPKGPNPPVDEGSVKIFAADKGFLEDPVVQQKLASAKLLTEVNAADYDAVFYPGGHGPVLDLATDPVNIKLASEVSIAPSSIHAA